LHEALEDTRRVLKVRDEELASCKALIRLLSEQLENAHKRINTFTNSPRTVSPEIPLPRERRSARKTPTLQSTEFIKASPGGSPGSLVSLESSIGSQSEDEEMESFDTDIHDDTVIDVRDPIESMKDIRLPFKLEHSPKVDRRGSIIDAMVPVTQHRTPLYSDRRQSRISAPSSSKVVTPPDSQPSQRVSRLVTPVVRGKLPTKGLPPTPDDSPVPARITSNRPPMTLRGRIFRSKLDVREPSVPPLEDPPAVVKKNSLIRFWKPKSPNSTRADKKPTAKEVFDYPPSPEKTPKLPLRDTTNITLPESDHLSRYPKIRPVSVASTQTTGSAWRQSIGRQVSEMVQHWEHETTRRSDIVSCAGYVSAKRVSVGASPLAVKAARDAWTATTMRGNGKRTSEERGERIDKLRRQRDELVRKMGLSTVPPNAAAA
jgi:hypothetical protein